MRAEPAGPALAVTHVERTGDPAVLRWVCHRDDLRAAPDGPRLPPPGSPLGRMLHDGCLLGVELHDGDLYVRAAEPAAWASLAAATQAAVAAELGADAPWLGTPAGSPRRLAVAAEPASPGGAAAIAGCDERAGAGPVCGGCAGSARCGAGPARHRWFRRRLPAATEVPARRGGDR